MKIKMISLTILISSAILISACGPKADSAPQGSASFAQALPNLAYPIEAVSSGIAQLTNGAFEEPAAPGSAAMTRIQLGPAQAFGDINGDGAEDAAVTLVVDSGGSGTFTYLALVLNQDGALRVLPAAFIGDRVVVRSLSIQPGQVVVDLLTRAADEPMSVEPTDQQRLVFNLSGGQLVQQGSS
jgi:hypothetical protein